MNVKPIRQMLRFKGVLIGCTDTCLAMLGNGQALGGMLLTEQIVRDASDERNPDPKSPGLRQSQLVAVAGKLHFEYTDGTGQTWADFGRRVSSRRLVIAQLWYRDIGGNAIGHAVLVIGRSGSNYAIVDPIKGRITTVTPTKLHTAMSHLATINGKGPNELFFGYSRPVPA